ncbi:hypothetical protein SLS57_009109 [Botryosphaeria dothidea]
MASNTGAPAAQASASYQMDSKDIERVVTDEDLKYDLETESAQEGIKKIEAVTSLWSKKILWVT